MSLGVVRRFQARTNRVNSSVVVLLHLYELVTSHVCCGIPAQFFENNDTQEQNK
jgi:hypothetical protein